ncbi:MAG: hypothetical protein ABIJ56_15505 [Pseudomonadota bacterium]
MKRFYLFTILAALLLAASWGCGDDTDDEEDAIEEQDTTGDEVSVETECDNDEDDDGDGDIDCDDSDCIGDPACPTECGDGVLTIDEECEPGEDEDACTADEVCNAGCECEAFCGNGTYESDLEECEPGEDESECTADEVCNNACECEAACGNGTYESDLEECEPGEDESECVESEFCNAGCECEVFCGNGTFESDLEDCEPGVDEDGCEADEFCDADTCDCLPLCGNGELDEGEECEPGVDETECEWFEACAPGSCACEAACGNGAFEPGHETCEPGVDETACGEYMTCAADCTCLGEYCGDGYVYYYMGEECDMGEANGPGSRCSDECKLQAICGDHYADWPETCDDGNTDDDDGCSSECQAEGEDIPNVCGDGIVVPWEQCEPGFEGMCPEGYACSPEYCHCMYVYCTDGMIMGDEECEFDWMGYPLEDNPCGSGDFADFPYCSYETCTCMASMCGDGDIDGDEQCEFGEGVMGDCSGETPACDWDTCLCVAAECGDGQYTEGAEECDFDWMYWGDLGCSDQYCDLDTCTCVDSLCGDGYIEADEECDFDPETGEVLEDIPCGSGEYSGLPTCDPIDCTCVLEYCGDGTVDEGEECEVDAGCESDAPRCEGCQCVAEECPEGVTPIEITDDFLEDDGFWHVTGTQPDTVIGFYNFSYDCWSSGPETVYTFSPPTDGVYVITTLSDTTDFDTVLLVLAECGGADDDFIDCNDDSYETLQSTLDHDFSEGATYYIIVDSYGSSGAAGEFELTIGELTEAGEGEDCDAFAACAGEGLECINGTCQTPADPVLDEDADLYAALEPPAGNYLINFTGSDANHDVRALVWTPLDSDGEPLTESTFGWILNDSSLQYTGEDGVFEGLAGVSLDSLPRYGIAVEDVAGIGYFVVDSLGAETEPAAVDLADAIAVQDTEGDPCPVPPLGSYLTCDEGMTCEPDASPATPFDGSCAAASGDAPVILDVIPTAYWLSDCGEGDDYAVWSLTGLAGHGVGVWQVDGDFFGEDGPLTNATPWDYPPYVWSFSDGVCLGGTAADLMGETLTFSVRDLAGQWSEGYDLVH